MTGLPDLSNIHRINIVGTTGSGKSTFSKKLAAVLKCPYIEMDCLFWQANWQATPDEVFFKKVEIALQTERWVLDGNYTRTTPIKWKQVQMVIWLDYPFYLVFMRTIKRVINRLITNQELWPGTGNRESLRMVLGKDSIILWMLKTYTSNKEKYSAVMQDSAYKHIVFIRISNSQQAAKFLKEIKKPDEGLM